MIQWRYWGTVCGVFLLVGGGCTVKQQQDVLAGVGSFIPGSRNSMFYPESPSTSPQRNGATATIPTSPGTTPIAAASSTPPPLLAPRNDLGTTDAQLVLQTMQRAMKENPKPFIDCLDESACRSALTTHLVRLQKLAGSTLELPAVYDRYDLRRGKE